MQKTPYEVSIDFPFYQSQKGLYFIGQTPLLSSPSGTALGVLNNPSCSGRLIYVNAITITNSSTTSLEAEFYLQPTITNGTVSTLVSSTNTVFCPRVFPVGSISYLVGTVPPPVQGVSIFSRIVPPQSTLVVDGGQIILGEMNALAVYIGGFSPVPFENLRFAFGWSEQVLSSCNYPTDEKQK